MTSSFDAQINYEPNNNCTDLTTNHPAVTTNICPFVLLLKSFYWYNFVHNMVIGHCIGNVKSMVLQMDIFNTDFAHICYVITFFIDMAFHWGNGWSHHGIITK